jgi:hypothetical protein
MDFDSKAHDEAVEAFLAQEGFSAQDGHDGAAPRDRQGRRKSAIAAAVCAAGLAACCIAGTAIASGIRGTDEEGVFLQSGTIPAALSGAAKAGWSKPEGYTDAEAEELLSNYSDAYTPSIATSSESPSVVAIMCESYADLTGWSGSLGIDYSNDLMSKVDPEVSGDLYVSMYGGGTCNTEFEFLTGCSALDFGSQRFPYASSIDGVDTIAKQMREAGYETWGIHPAAGSNWNRSERWRELGFDNCVFLDAMEKDGVDSDDMFHSGISDTRSYETVLDVLSSSSDPQFVFDVTFAGHGPYKLGNAQLTDSLSTDSISADALAEYSEYLACAERSNEDLLKLIDSIEEMDKPVILLFFGDHQPSFATGDEVEKLVAPLSGTELARVQDKRKTAYFIWKNSAARKASGGVGVLAAASGQNAVPKAKGLVEEASPNYLGAMLMEQTGVRLTEFQKAQMAMREYLPVVNAYGMKITGESLWRDLDGVSESGDVGDGAQIVSIMKRDMSFIDWKLFGSKIR